MRRPTIQTLAAILLSGATGLAGTFTNAFNDLENTAGATFAGIGTLTNGTSFSVITSNYLVLTTTNNDLMGSVILPTKACPKRVSGV